MYSFRARPC